MVPGPIDGIDPNANFSDSDPAELADTPPNISTTEPVQFLPPSKEPDPNQSPPLPRPEYDRGPQYNPEKEAAQSINMARPTVVVTPTLAKPPEPKQLPAAIAIDEKGLVTPKDHAELWRLADMFLKSRALPKQFENTAQVFMAMQYLRSRGLDPNVSIRQTMIVNGSINIWGDLPKALVIQSGLCEQFDEILYDKAYTTISYENKNLGAEVWGATCFIRRSGRPMVSRSFTVDEARAAGLVDKEKSLYKKWMRRMLQMRARGLAIKDEFPDVLGGCAIAEYDNHTDPGGENPPAPTGLADHLNDDYHRETGAAEPAATQAGTA